MWDYNTKSHFQVICIKIILLWLLVNVQTGFLRDSFNGSRANSEQSSECCQKAVGCFWMNYIEQNLSHPQPHWKDISKLKKSKNYIQVRFALKWFWWKQPCEVAFWRDMVGKRVVFNLFSIACQQFLTYFLAQHNAVAQPLFFSL